MEKTGSPRCARCQRPAAYAVDGQWTCVLCPPPENKTKQGLTKALQIMGAVSTHTLVRMGMSNQDLADAVHAIKTAMDRT